MNNNVIIVGGGPAGLFCAYHLIHAGYQVEMFEHQTGVGKKFLVAGHGGLNLTHSEDLSRFAARYEEHEDLFSKLLNSFGPQHLREWCLKLGVETFVGSSGRVFPKTFKAADILARLLKVLKESPHFQLHTRYKLSKIQKDGELHFMSPQGEEKRRGDYVIYGLGGASWEKTGSDGLWPKLFTDLGIQVKPFLPMNCGFEITWSSFMLKKLVEPAPLKNIKLSFGKKEVAGEVMLTAYGIEGGAVYALSRFLRDEILQQEKCILSLDVKPQMTIEELEKTLGQRKKKESLSHFFKTKLKLAPIVFTLLKEFVDLEAMNFQQLARALKSVPIVLERTRPISEAISTSGGIDFSELNENLELTKLEHHFVMGEMLDFDAPTGGYLLQGCFSTAWHVFSAIYSKKL